MICIYMFSLSEAVAVAVATIVSKLTTLRDTHIGHEGTERLPHHRVVC